MKIKTINIDADLVVAGGGMPGICTAVQAARMGLKVALINNRTCFGGNASAEVMINLSGANGTQEFNYNARETGVIEELWLDNLYKNPHANRWIWDTVVLNKLMNEKNISLYPNTCIDEVIMKDAKNIECICGTQSTTQTRFCFFAPLFVDDTGDGAVAYLANAQYHYGREAQSEYHERLAPEKSDNGVLPSTMIFTSEKRDYPVPFEKPDFATDIPATGALQYRVIPQNDFGNFKWFYEIDGELDQIFDAEKITEHQRALVFGIWDYIKNSGKYDSANHELSFVSPIPGKRESRRFLGDYVLRESDLTEQTQFDDCVGHGGWSIDLHAIKGFYAKEPINRHVLLNGVYQIPFRCAYSKDIDNLFLEGRCMSLSHVAHGSVRVIATLSTIGQANGVAAALCNKFGCSPRDIYKQHMDELQNELLKYDQYIIGKQYSDEKDIAQKAHITVSSEKKMCQMSGDSSTFMGNGIGITLPVREHFMGICLYARSQKDTQIKYSVYCSDKPENYKPQKLLYRGNADVRYSNKFLPVNLTADIQCKSGYYFIKLEGDSKIEFQTSKLRWTGIEMSYLAETGEDNYIDLDTLKPREFMYRQLQEKLCFIMLKDESVFGADNLKNGYTRPYILPNVWHSDGVKNEFIRLQWDNVMNISNISIIFDSYVNEYFRYETTRTDGRRPTIVKDYDIIAVNQDGTNRVIAEVRDNYQRINNIKTDNIKTNELYIKFIATNGQPFVSVFGVRVY